MGLNFRRSIRVGKYFKINISKSGIGYSFGTRGFRTSVSSRGRTTISGSVPGTGISYSHTLGTTHRTSPSGTSHRPNNHNNAANQIPQDNRINIESANLINFQNSEKKELIKNINFCKNINTASIIIILCGIVASIAFKTGNPYLGVLGILMIIAGVAGLISSFIYFPVHLDYSGDEELFEKHSRLINALKEFCMCNGKWQVLSYAINSNTKVHSGAKANVSREFFSFSNELPFFLKTSAPYITLNLKNEKLIFFPEQVAIIRGSGIGFIDLADIEIKTSPVEFVENLRVPNDTEIIRYTWKYVNKNGGPDKRFNDNRQLPLCKYGNIKFTSSNGLNVWLQCSNCNKLSLFNEFINR